MARRRCVPDGLGRGAVRGTVARVMA
jgi:hypothetical protein